MIINFSDCLALDPTYYNALVQRIECYENLLDFEVVFWPYVEVILARGDRL